MAHEEAPSSAETAGQSVTQGVREAPSVPERIRIIKQMMVCGEWREGVSDHDLGDAWGIEPNTVRRAAAEASRALRSAAEDEGLVGRFVAILLNNVNDARKARRFEAVAKSVEVAAKLMGMDGSKAPAADIDRKFVVELTDEPGK